MGYRATLNGKTLIKGDKIQYKGNLYTFDSVMNNSRIYVHDLDDHRNKISLSASKLGVKIS